jgi:uncharacterized membrane protein (DUF4010 family)
MDVLTAEATEIGLVRDFIIALSIGALIGIEREQKSATGGPQFGGLRTFILIATLGALAGWLDGSGRLPVLFLTGFVGVAVLLSVSAYLEGVKEQRVTGLTTEVAALLTYLLGGAVTLGHANVAVMLAVTTLTVLAFKQPMHAAARALGRDDIVAGIKLLAATFIVLPLLPDRTMDPWGALNPYKLWWLVILISSLSLIGYVAVRMLGERRGMALTGLFGGLVSSTAVTLTFARRSREKPAAVDALAVGILVSWTIMFVRVIIEVAVVNAALLRTLMPSMLAMFVASAAMLGWLYRHAARVEETVSQQPAEGSDVLFRNPFNLTSAVQFGLFFAAVLLVVKLARLYVPENWVYGIAALAGATDVDAITLSLAELARGDLPGHVAVLSILIATWSNTAVKCAMVIALGNGALARRIFVGALLIGLSGAAVFGLQGGAAG